MKFHENFRKIFPEVFRKISGESFRKISEISGKFHKFHKTWKYNAHVTILYHVTVKYVI